MQDEFVTIAKVTRPQGRKGEIAAALLTDFPELFATRRRLFAVSAHGRRREVELEEHWFHKGQVVLKLNGVDSITAAEALVGSEIQVPRSERAELDAGTVYVNDLVGCAVYDGDLQIGSIQDVRFGAGEAPLLVVKGTSEFLLPFAAEYIREVCLPEKRLMMKLPEGILELDAPLTAEEKQQQKRGA